MYSTYFTSISKENLKNMISDINREDVCKTVCKNIKKFRLERYREFKENISHDPSLNPYSTQNISELLNYSHNFYKRFE